MVLIPIHVPGHWLLCVVHVKEKAIDIYDSIPKLQRGLDIACAIFEFLKDEHIRVNSEPLSTGDWVYYIPTVSLLSNMNL